MRQEFDDGYCLAVGGDQAIDFDPVSMRFMGVDDHRAFQNRIPTRGYTQIVPA
jgi:hypothetical protein